MDKQIITVDKSKTFKNKQKVQHNEKEKLFKDDLKDNLKESLTPESYSMFLRDKMIFIAVCIVAYGLFGFAYWLYTKNQGSLMYVYSGLLNFLFAILIAFNYKANWYYLMRKLMFNMGQVIVVQKNKKLFKKFVDLNKYPVYINKVPYFPDPRTIIMDGNMPTYGLKQGCTGSIDYDNVKENVLKDGIVQANSVVDAKLIDNILSAQEEVVESKKNRDVVKELWKLAKWWLIGACILAGISAILAYTMYDQWITMFPDGKLSPELFVNAIKSAQG